MKSFIKEPHPYHVILFVFLIFTVFSLLHQTPVEIFWGLVRINMSRSVLITDYVAVGGIGAALMNSVLVSGIALAFLMRMKVAPTGATIMAIYLTMGFALFGKNILNMIPITMGVYLYSKIVKKPYAQFHLTAVLAATISPITSEIMFLNLTIAPINIVGGIFIGILAGFLFPMIASFVLDAQRGMNLYNMGFVGGLLGTFFIAFLNSVGIRVETESIISSGYNLNFAILMYVLSAFLVLCGVLFGDMSRLWKDFRALIRRTGKLSSDFYVDYGANIYINMGLLGILGTSVLIFLGADFNGPTVTGVLTIAGFGAFGKHLRNVVPLIIGALLATQINQWDTSDTSNMLAILFSTGLAPIAGRYGAVWGLLAGFLHVSAVHHTGSTLNSGLNLYNNGFAAGFVVITLVPIIEGLTKVYTKLKPKNIDLDGDEA